MSCNLTIYEIISFYMIYSFLGWTVEVIYQAVSKGKVINRGFLNGPVCPIYGFGVISILFLLNLLSRGNEENVNAFGIFIFGVILSTLIELFGGWVMDRIFHARWWDYRDRKFNLNGYICLEFSIYWGIGILLTMRVVHPFIRRLVNWHSVTLLSWIILAILAMTYLADFIVSVFIMIGLNKRFAELDEMQEKMRVVSNRLSTRIGEDTLEKMEKIEKVKQEAEVFREDLAQEIKEEREEREEVRKARLQEMEKHFLEKRKEYYRRLHRSRLFGTGRMIHGNPTFRYQKYQQYIDELKNIDPDHLFR